MDDSDHALTQVGFSKDEVVQALQDWFDRCVSGVQDVVLCLPVAGLLEYLSSQLQHWTCSQSSLQLLTCQHASFSFSPLHNTIMSTSNKREQISPPPDYLFLPHPSPKRQIQLSPLLSLDLQAYKIFFSLALHIHLRVISALQANAFLAPKKKKNLK